jgi:hypothetical protein
LFKSLPLSASVIAYTCLSQYIYVPFTIYIRLHHTYRAYARMLSFFGTLSLPRAVDMMKSEWIACF